mgnify:CR=1 FL=1
MEEPGAIRSLASSRYCFLPSDLPSAGSGGASFGRHTRAPWCCTCSGDQSASDTDNVRSGDQSAPDTTSATGDKESSSSEQSDAGEQPDTPGENVGSETPGNDGPGGHADEPGNAGADHQFEGQE